MPTPRPRTFSRLAPAAGLAALLPLLLVLLSSAKRAPAPEGALASATDFINFECLPVHPVALTPDGSRLLVLDIPDARLEVYDLTSGSPVLLGEVAVGLEPVSVAARTNTEAWVVNQVSDDISVLDLTTLHVTATIRTGDEPSDVAFAAGKAFVCVSGEDALKTYDVTTHAQTGSALPTPFARHPRALAVNAAGTEIYVTVRESGNKTTTLAEPFVSVGGGLPPPNPAKSDSLPAAPSTSLIVQFQGGHWVDERGAGVKTWDSVIPYTLTETGLIAFSTSSGAVLRSVTGIGSNILNAAVSSGGQIYATSLAAGNLARFEINLRGRFLQNRIALAAAGGAGAISSFNLNDTTLSASLALALPVDVAVNAAGSKVYLSAMGSGKVGVLNVAGGVTNRITSGSGPTGLALDAARHRLYVLNRFSNSLAVINTDSETRLSDTPLRFDPSPSAVTAGRALLYDASRSAHGDLACASCHLGADVDGLAWDLGDPQGKLQPAPAGQIDPLLTSFHPMKGPTMTQSLRGLGGIHPLHWRGDRADLTRFNPAFKSLLGAPDTLSTSQIQALSDFVQTVAYPPNPNQNLDRTLPDPVSGPSAARGQNEFLNVNHDGTLRCVQCHTLPSGTNGQIVDATALGETQQFKVAHLTNLYQKTGLTRAIGSQSRGFGFIHDGSVDNLFNFLKSSQFQFASDAQRHDVESFLMCFDTGLAPAVGREITLDSSNKGNPDALALLDTLYNQANAGSCDLVAHAYRGGVVRGYFYSGNHAFISDYTSDGTIPSDSLVAWAAAGKEVTFSGVPFGSGRRMSIDRDRDGFRDRNEVLLGSNPADPASVPSATAVREPEGDGPVARLGVGSPNPFSLEAFLPFEIRLQGRVSIQVYDSSGRLIRKVLDENLPAGRYHARWDGRDSQGTPASSGRYFVRLTTQGVTSTRTLTRVR